MEDVLDVLIGGTVVRVEMGMLVVRKDGKEYVVYGHDGGQYAEMGVADRRPHAHLL